MPPIAEAVDVVAGTVHTLEVAAAVEGTQRTVAVVVEEQEGVVVVAAVVVAEGGEAEEAQFRASSRRRTIRWPTLSQSVSWLARS